MADYDRGRDHRDRSDSRRRMDRGGDRGGDRSRGEGGGGGDRAGSNMTSLLVRNLSFNLRADEIRRIFSRYGDVRDVYIPQDYYNRKPRGFAFIEFFNRRDALEAMDRLDRYEVDGRELSIVLAKDRRKTPDEMKPRTRDRKSSRSRSRDRGGDRSAPRPERRSPSPRSPVRRSPSPEAARGRSPSPAVDRKRSPSPSPARRDENAPSRSSSPAPNNHEE